MARRTSGRDSLSDQLSKTLSRQRDITEAAIRKLSASMEAQPPFGDRSADDRTPRPRVIGVPGVSQGARLADPLRADVVCPGYGGHLPGAKMRFGRAESFHRPDGEVHETTPRPEADAQNVRLARPTTAWEEMGSPVRRQIAKSASTGSLQSAEWTPRGTSPFKDSVSGARGADTLAHASSLLAHSLLTPCSLLAHSLLTPAPCLLHSPSLSCLHAQNALCTGGRRALRLLRPPPRRHAPFWHSRHRHAQHRRPA